MVRPLVVADAVQEVLVVGTVESAVEASAEQVVEALRAVELA